MAWGVFEKEEIIHVVPINYKTEKIDEPHELHEFCPCDPKIEIENNKYIILHNREN